MAERILIPLDGSKMGEAALRYVSKMVEKLEPGKMPEVTLLTVFIMPINHIPVEGGVVDIADDTNMQQAKDLAMIYLNEAGKDLVSKGFTVDCLVKIGEFGVSSAESIIKAEDETNADLVAMSTHGRRGVSRWAYGSVTEKVLRGGRLPVLMVRVKKEEE